jgi:hypothetical protein
VLGEATIGPEGGVLAIDTGVQAGLRLTVPSGALMQSTRIRVHDATPVPLPGIGAPVIAAPPAYPFSFEPLDLRLEERATLRMPYETGRLYGTAPGNVRAREQRNGFAIDHDPDLVDVQGGFLELPIRHLSQYEVIRGPVAGGIAEYWPPTGAPVQLADGITFTVEAVPSTSPFASPEALRWVIAGAPVFGAQDVDLLYFDDEHRLLGRESLDEDWREVWSQPYFPWVQAEVSLPVGSVTMLTQVSRPMTQLPIGGQITVSSMWSWSAPRTVAGRLLYDVAKLYLSLAWNRADLGVGQREYQFWFAPGIGLVAFAEDGLVHERTSLP